MRRRMVEENTQPAERIGGRVLHGLGLLHITGENGWLVLELLIGAVPQGVFPCRCLRPQAAKALSCLRQRRSDVIRRHLDLDSTHVSSACATVQSI